MLIQKTTNILLIYPPYQNLSGYAEAVLPPLGLASLASFLEHKGIYTEIIDSAPEKKSVADIIKTINEKQPKLVGVYCNTPFFPIVKSLIEAIKKQNSKPLLIVGGPHITALKEKIFKDIPQVDAAAIGEGEYTLYEYYKTFIIQGKNKQIEGIITSHSKASPNLNFSALPVDINSIPLPAYTKLLHNKYRPSFKWYLRKSFLPAMISRGCSFNCAFCLSPSTSHRKVRFLNGRKLDELFHLLCNEIGIRQIIFYDDVFTFNKKICLQVMEKLKKKHFEKNIVWGCLTRADCLDTEILTAMKNSGCKMISMGIESGDSNILQKLRKKINFKKTKQIIDSALKMGIETNCTFIIGSPWDNFPTLNSTLKCAKKLDPTFAEFFKFVPYPGTAIWESMATKKKINFSNPATFMEGNFKSLPWKINLNSKELKKFIKQTYISFYLRPQKVIQHILRIKNPFIALGYIRAIVNYFRI